MQIKSLFNGKVPFCLALLIIMAAAVYTEQLFLDSRWINDATCNSTAALSLSGPNRVSLSPAWLKSVKEKVALASANIPLVPGAQRLTFDRGNTVRYRVNAPANLVAVFYRQILASQGWRTGQSANVKQDRLAIALVENPLSGKTDITYTYASQTAVAVLGVKIAEADTSAPAPDNSAPAPQQPQPSQPSPDQNQAPTPGQQPMQPQQPTPGQYQPNQGQYQPNQQQNMPNNQTQPYQPMNQQNMPPMNQPGMNQMEFNRQPMQPYNNGEQGQTQTCRVNGVEMPGPCQQYNNQGQMNQDQMGPGQNGSNGQQMNQPGQQGPSEEEQKKNDERRFKDMKRGLAQFVTGAKQMKRSLAKIKTANAKCGVGLPEELENALTQTDSLAEKINAAKTADELDEIVGDIQDVGSVMQDWGPRMGDLNRICQMLKQAEKDAKQFDRNIKRLESQAKANKKVDLSELLAEYKAAVDEQKNVLAQAKELAKTDAEEALAKIEDDFYGNMDNLGNLQMQIDTIVNISKGLKDISRELTNFASQIKSLARKKVDTTAMQELLNTLKTQVEEIKTLIKDKADAEELASKIEEAFDTRQELQDTLQEYDVINMIPQFKAGTNYNVKVNLPEAFRKTETNDNEGMTEEQPAKPAPTSSGGASGGAATKAQ